MIWIVVVLQEEHVAPYRQWDSFETLAPVQSLPNFRWTHDFLCDFFAHRAKKVKKVLVRSLQKKKKKQKTLLNVSSLFNWVRNCDTFITRPPAALLLLLSRKWYPMSIDLSGGLSDKSLILCGSPSCQGLCWPPEIFVVGPLPSCCYCWLWFIIAASIILSRTDNKPFVYNPAHPLNWWR